MSRSDRAIPPPTPASRASTKTFRTKPAFSGRSSISTTSRRPSPRFPEPLNSAVGPTETTGYENTLGVTQNLEPDLHHRIPLRFLPQQLRDYSAQPRHQRRADAGHREPVWDRGAGIRTSTAASPCSGSNTNTIRTQIDNNYQTYLNNSKSIGNHLLTFGGQLRKDQFDDFNPNCRREWHLQLRRRHHLAKNQLGRCHQRAGRLSAGRHQDLDLFSASAFDRKAQLEYRPLHSGRLESPAEPDR